MQTLSFRKSNDSFTSGCATFTETAACRVPKIRRSKFNGFTLTEAKANSATMLEIWSTFTLFATYY